MSQSVNSKSLPLLVLVALTGLAGAHYTSFYQRADQLWWWLGHDRSTHYLHGLNLAWDLRSRDFPKLLHDLDTMRVWGPLHGLLVALTQLLAGPDYRLAVLPSLVAWVGTAWFAFLIVRRMLPSASDVAGLLAATCVMLSPAHRALATDVMLESTGACLTLLTLYTYLRYVQEPGSSARWMALSLTALFFTKYNYWLLVVFGLVGGELLRQPSHLLSLAGQVINVRTIWGWGTKQLRNVFTYPLLILGGMGFHTMLGGQFEFKLFEQALAITSPHGLLNGAWACLGLRLAWWWWHGGRQSFAGWNSSIRDLASWHFAPIGVWFLLPKRLGYFLWYLSPANSDQVREKVPFLHGLPHYLEALRNEYLVADGTNWAVLVLAALVGLALLTSWRMCPGSWTVFVLLSVAAFLTCQHPMLKSRFLHSWIALSWIVAGAGLAATLGLVLRERWLNLALGIALAGLAVHQPSAWLAPGHAQEAGLKSNFAPILAIPRTYLPELASAKHPTMLCNVSARFFLSWTFIERHRHLHFDAEIKNFKKDFERNPERLAWWLAQSQSDAIVVIEVLPGSPYEEITPEHCDLTTLNRVLEYQMKYTRSREWLLPEGVRITLWRDLVPRPV